MFEVLRNAVAHVRFTWNTWNTYHDNNKTAEDLVTWVKRRLSEGRSPLPRRVRELLYQNIARFDKLIWEARRYRALRREIQETPAQDFYFDLRVRLGLQAAEISEKCIKLIEELDDSL